jgi:hypothetical protein
MRDVKWTFEAAFFLPLLMYHTTAHWVVISLLGAHVCSTTLFLTPLRPLSSSFNIAYHESEAQPLEPLAGPILHSLVNNVHLVKTVIDWVTTFLHQLPTSPRTTCTASYGYHHSQAQSQSSSHSQSQSQAHTRTPAHSHSQSATSPSAPIAPFVNNGPPGVHHFLSQCPCRLPLPLLLHR